MDGRLKARTSGSVPSTLGRQIGVLPVGNPPPRARRPQPRQILSTPPQSKKYIDEGSGPVQYNEVNAGIYSDKTLSAERTTNDQLSARSGKVKLKQTSPPTSDFSSRPFSKKFSPSPPSSSRYQRSPGSAGKVKDTLSSARSTSSRSRNDKEQEVEFWEKKPPKTVTEEEILDQSQESDVNRIYDINLHASELTVVPKLDKFPNLRVLDLSCNYIERIENLDQSKDLRELKLYDNRLTAVENLKNLKELVALQLQYNKLKQLGKGFSSLKKLKTLRIDCNKILRLDASELSCCVQLTSINVSYNLVDNLSALNYLPNLEECYAAGNRIKTVDLSRCKKLQDIDVSKNRLTDLSGIRNLANLQTLNISSNQITSLKSLGKSKSLQELYASGNRISELSFIPDVFPRLEIFNISCNSIKTLDEVCCLERCEDIAELFLYENPFCAPGSEHTHYMAEIQAIIPQLEILDGAHIKRHTHRGAPIMRPMSASTIISVRQVETQMKAMDNEMVSFEKSIMDRFESLRTACGIDYTDSRMSSSNPEPSLTLTSQQRPSCKSSSRSKIRDALQFASQNFDE
ncbi:protein phosphatase 1 regulatory subunit 7-like isoform X1 [Saccostrea cucullata]|uniref:protein phosphatase 1 regulatory subunit 7-like isoform X1 n=1 Tax=Saccostrea cuccullata TaxID=36930 RepID=UPI002ED1969B